MSQNLVPGGHNRRTIIKDVTEYVGPEKILERITQKTWPYKINVTFYVTRDRALLALIYLTSGRINEVLRLLKSQFQPHESDDEILMIQNFWVSKRWKGGMKKKRDPIYEDDVLVGYKIIEVYVPPSRHPIIPIPLPRVGPLAPFTEMVEEYLSILNEEKLFSFGKGRAWDIVNTITGGGQGNRDKGVWCHWFRDQSLSYFVNTLRGSILGVARQRGIQNVQTLDHYYRGDWELTKGDLKGER